MTITTKEQKLPTCPEWCTSDHTGDFDDEADRQHVGRINETFDACLTLGDDLGVTLILREIDDNTDLNAAALRQFASDALAGAEWLEAHS